MQVRKGILMPLEKFLKRRFSQIKRRWSQIVPLRESACICVSRIKQICEVSLRNPEETQKQKLHSGQSACICVKKVFFRDLILIILIALACLFSYFNTLFSYFVWDDNIFIVANPYMHSFKFLPQYFTQDFWNIGIKTVTSGYYRPLLAASFMLDHALWGRQAFGFHLTNLILHILASILVFIFVEALLKEKRIAFFSSLIFSMHPLHTESVSFISGRVDILPLVFMLLSLVLFLRYVAEVSKKNIFNADLRKSNADTRRFIDKPICDNLRYICDYLRLRSIFQDFFSKKKFVLYLLSLFCFFVSMLTKEMAVTLPLIVLVMDYLFISRRKVKEVIKNFPRFHLGFFLVLGIYLLMRFYFIGWSFILGNSRYVANFLPGKSAYWQFFTVIKILTFYIRLLFFPYGLKADYLFPAANSLFEPVVFSGVIILLLLAFIALKNVKSHPILPFSIIWFFITVLPVSNLFPLGNIFAERYMYIPSVGFCIGVGFLFSWLLKKDIKMHSLDWKKSVTLVFFLLVLALGRVTYERNKVWNNEFSLWYETAKAAPQSPRAHINLASAYYALNLLDKAIEEVKTALKIYPAYYEAFDTLGHIYLKKGLFNEAARMFKQAISIYPDRAAAYNGLAAAYGRNGQYQEAIEAALTSLKHNPCMDEARYNLALSYSKIGRVEEALKTYEEYLNTNPDNASAHVEAGQLYYKKGDYKKAKEHWLSALKISKDYPQALEALKLLERQE